MSFRITISPSKRAAGRFIEAVRRSLLKALEEESADSGLSQSDVARSIGIDRSVVHRELRGHKDITLGRVAELAWAMGRKTELTLPKQQDSVVAGANICRQLVASSGGTSAPVLIRETQN